MAALLVTFSAMGGLLREFVLIFKKPRARALIAWMAGLLLIGMTFYHFAEGWSWLDSLYFCVITLSTVGYGDLDPTTPASKIFTIVYIFIGLSIFISLVNMLAKARQEIRAERSAKIHHSLKSPSKSLKSSSEAVENHVRNPDSTEDSS